MYNLGYLYDTGDLVPQDEKEAVKWYRLAIKNGNLEGRERLAELEKKQN
ncbi:MAG: SEL1-like repeat protein [Deltaproteobacteria bacterium]|jgi:TPR repeat protein|nr:SEL1-like repeat protein [Deltaproteobacteria bacterium]